MQGRSISKWGNAESENEDAWLARTHTWHNPKPSSRGLDREVFRIAVSDGATETSFSREWASMLVDYYTGGADSRPRLMRDIAHPRQTWTDCVTKRPLPWYAEQKRQMGAFATLLGLRITVGRRATSQTSHHRTGHVWWRGTAIGDTCLFVIRNDQLRRAWPVADSTRFGCRPSLLRSTQHLDGSSEPIVFETSGSLMLGDLCFLLTDAVAHWFLLDFENGGKPWNCLGEALGSDDGFAGLMATLRDTGEMRNDDATAVGITVGR